MSLWEIVLEYLDCILSTSAFPALGLGNKHTGEVFYLPQSLPTWVLYFHGCTEKVPSFSFLPLFSCQSFITVSCCYSNWKKNQWKSNVVFVNTAFKPISVPTAETKEMKQDVERREGDMIMKTPQWIWEIKQYVLIVWHLFWLNLTQVMKLYFCF